MLSIFFFCMSNKNFYIVLKKILLVLGVFYTMYSNHIHPYSSWLFLNLPLPSLPIHLCVHYKKSISKEICAAQVFLDVWSSTGVLPGATLAEKIVSSSHNSCWSPMAPWPGVGLCVQLPLHAGTWSALGLVWLWGPLCSCSDVFRRHRLLVVVYFFWLLDSSHDLFSIGPSALGGDVQHICSS